MTTDSLISAHTMAVIATLFQFIGYAALVGLPGWFLWAVFGQPLWKRWRTEHKRASQVLPKPASNCVSLHDWKDRQYEVGAGRNRS